MKEPKILVTGANGQIGTALTQSLRKEYGKENVIASDIKEAEFDNYPFEFLDILNKVRLEEIIQDLGITQIYHLAAILSASGEANPKKTWNVNLNGLLRIFTIAERNKLEKIFFPSTIAVYGATTPRVNTPQDTPLLPETVYGMSKVAGELWANYFFKRYNLDIRSIRYPGIIGYETIPSGGTTDYAVELFHAALKEKSYTCFLKPDTRLPMMYMPDAIKATISIMKAAPEKINVRSSYNLAAMDFTPAEIAEEIKKYIPEFKINYEPDFRQEIAESWSESIDDINARNDWGWKAAYDLSSMVKDMLHQLS
jgi:nucleoside-diphosphate-sugar epimerase